ncbi:putative lipoprotein [Myxococcus hansupus]|uniref:Putative lipoprotein n=2 Tax=Pseudomyxococcus hansupus TaxID=1297742 RepID=A0A0H4X739_9BACT|nr:putative lipoprotein [Myxococcus hansupus]
MALVMLTACGTPPSESQAPAGAEEHVVSQEAALRGDCYVTVECANGSTRECSGSAFSCTSGPAYNGHVSCDGVVTACGLINDPQPTCNTCSRISDGCCNPFCFGDPDCR